jgi:hypothetical protein
MRCRNKMGWAATRVAQNAAESSPARLLKLCLSGLATGARREVDDLAPQFFRSPLLLWMEVCRNVEFNQFRHDVLLAGDPTPLRELSAEPMPESGPVKVHISLFLTFVFTSSKLNATYKNTKVKEELLAGMREKTQVW